MFQGMLEKKDNVDNLVDKFLASAAGALDYPFGI